MSKPRREGWYAAALGLLILCALFLHPAYADALPDNGWYEAESKWYYFVNGQMLRSVVIEIEEILYGFTETGAMLEMDQDAFLTAPDGTTGWYRAMEGGELYQGEWVTVFPAEEGKERYYYRSDGRAASGPTNLGDEVFLFSERGKLLCNSEILIDGEKWKSDEYGYLSKSTDLTPPSAPPSSPPSSENQGGDQSGNQGGNQTGGQTGNQSGDQGGSQSGDQNPPVNPVKNGWTQLDDGTFVYYINDVMLRSLITEIEEKYYCFLDNGRPLCGEAVQFTYSDGTGSGWIRARADGSLYRNEFFLDPGSQIEYYYGADCFLASGFVVFPNGTAFFRNGIRAVNERLSLNGCDCLIDAGGFLLCGGWINRSAERCFVPEAEYLFYATADGILLTGLQELDETRYLFGPDGRLLTGLHYIYEGLHLSKADGRYIGRITREGWNEIDGERYYLFNGQMMSEGRHTIDWQFCYFNEDGMLLHDCLREDELLDSDGHIIPAGWVQRTEGRYFVNPDTGKIVQGREYSIENQSYYFDDAGLMVTGEVIVDGVLRRYGEDGVKLADPPEGSGGTGQTTEESDPDAGYLPTNEPDLSVTGTVTGTGGSAGQGTGGITSGPTGGSTAGASRQTSNSGSGSAGGTGTNQPDSDTAGQNGTQYRTRQNGNSRQSRSGLYIWRGDAWQAIPGIPGIPAVLRIMPDGSVVCLTPVPNQSGAGLYVTALP